jgi:DNA-binding NarL/FixJ family response regulator
MITAIPVQRGKPRLGLVAGLVAAARGLAFAGLMLAELGLLAVLLAAVGLTALGCGILVVGNGASGTQQALLGLLLTGAGLGLGWFAAPGTLTAVRSLARQTRRLAGQWCGVPIADPYRPPPVHDDEPLTLARRLGWLLTDRATWRDLRWILVNLAGWLLTALPAAIVLTGLIEFIGPELLRTIPPPAFPGHAAGTLILLGLGIIAVGVVAAPWLLRGYALLASSMLAPTFTDEGIRAALAARRKVPGLPVLVLSQYVEQLYARELLASGTGGIGYLLKDRVFDSAQFVDAVRRVAAGGTAMDPEVISRLLARNSGAGTLAVLSPREREVLALMAEGRSNAAIAQRMVITERAVAKHTASIFTRLNLQPSDDDNRRVLAVLAYLGG